MRPTSRSDLALVALASAALFASTLLPVVAEAQTAPGAASTCPGRVAVIEAVQHPQDSDSVGTREQRSAWAIRTQDQVQSCVAQGVISAPYGYYLRLKVAARIIRYLKQTSFGDSTEVREAEAAFDSLFIAARPTLVGTTFANLADELRRSLQPDVRLQGPGEKVLISAR